MKTKLKVKRRISWQLGLVLAISVLVLVLFVYYVLVPALTPIIIHEYGDAYVDAHDEMAKAERHYNKAVDYIHAKMFDSALTELISAKENSRLALLKAREMEEHAKTEDEKNLAYCMSNRAYHFNTAMIFYIDSVKCLKQIDEEGISMTISDNPIVVTFGIIWNIFKYAELKQLTNKANALIVAGNNQIRRSWDYAMEEVKLTKKIPSLRYIID